MVGPGEARDASMALSYAIDADAGVVRIKVAQNARLFETRSRLVTPETIELVVCRVECQPLSAVR
jgi:hypothetical protein